MRLPFVASRRILIYSDVLRQEHHIDPAGTVHMKVYH